VDSITYGRLRQRSNLVHAATAWDKFCEQNDDSQNRWGSESLKLLRVDEPERLINSIAQFIGSQIPDFSEKSGI
jgi:hypothetical protein